MNNKALIVEEWRDIQGYEGYYQVSNFGRIKSLPRGNKTPRWRSQCAIRKQSIKNRYCQINLSKDGKIQWRAVHRLVALAFLPNPNNLPQVNHKDENPSNNHVSNLEWCDAIYNMNYGTVRDRMSHTKITKEYRTKVLQIKDGQVVATYNSAHDAQRKTGIGMAAICKVCQGKPKHKTAGGYEWKRINNP